MLVLLIVPIILRLEEDACVRSIARISNNYA